MICFFNKTYCFQLEWRRIELKKILHKMKMTKNFKKYTKDTINDYVYVEKNIINFKIIYGM